METPKFYRICFKFWPTITNVIKNKCKLEDNQSFELKKFESQYCTIIVVVQCDTQFLTYIFTLIFDSYSKLVYCKERKIVTFWF